jgi:hypothetical protein
VLFRNIVKEEALACWGAVPPKNKNLHKQIATVQQLCMISGFRSEVAKNCALLGYYLLFLDSLSLRVGPLDCTETSEKTLPLLAT